MKLTCLRCLRISEIIDFYETCHYCKQTGFKREEEKKK